jgi:hypothetical protein
MPGARLHRRTLVSQNGTGGTAGLAEAGTSRGRRHSTQWTWRKKDAAVALLPCERADIGANGLWRRSAEAEQR